MKRRNKNGKKDEEHFEKPRSPPPPQKRSPRAAPINPKHKRDDDHERFKRLVNRVQQTIRNHRKES